MNQLKTAVLTLGVLAGAMMAGNPPAAEADIVRFVLLGRAGSGILSENEVPTATGGGSGGIIGGGIQFDTVTNILTLNIGWGSGQGFTDLTSSVSLFNIHGPTASAGPLSFNESAPALLSIDAINASATNGGFSGTVAIPAGNANDLLTGRLYLHIHTDNNPGGEARGYLVAIPEPLSLPIAMLATVSMGLVRRRRCRCQQP